MRNDKLLNYLHLHFIVFIWGFTAVLGALISLEAIPLVWYRMLIATVLVYIFIGFKKISLRFPKKVLLVLLLAGLIIAVHWLTFFGAIKASNVSVTLSVMSTGALFTSFLEPIFFRRKIILYEVAFGIIAALGLYMIFRASAEYVLGIALALISAFLSALMSVINGIYAKRYNASAISFFTNWDLGFCALQYICFLKVALVPIFFDFLLPIGSIWESWHLCVPPMLILLPCMLCVGFHLLP